MQRRRGRNSGATSARYFYLRWTSALLVLDFILRPLGAQPPSSSAEFRESIPPKSNSIPLVIPTDNPPETFATERVAVINQPYWKDLSKAPFKASEDRVARMAVEEMVMAALAHSPKVKAVLTVPQIRETEVQQAQGVFDPTRFANSIWNDRSDPIGNTLTTGGPKRLNDRNVQNSFGVRSKNQLGGSLEAQQDIGLKDTNSLFFQPHQQADTKFLVKYTQPLMRGAGKTYNRSAIAIAQIQAGVAQREASQSLQEHALDVIQDYWSLYYYRIQRLQLRRGVDRIRSIEEQLRNRVDLDSVKNQFDRARAAAEILSARYVRADADALKAESTLRSKVNAPWIQYEACDEIIPSSEPLPVSLEINPEQELDTALGYRPEILLLRDELQAANVRLRVAQNDLKPTLNLLTDMYVRGLNGSYDVGNSIGDQFSTGRPSYSAGLEYLRPRQQIVARAIQNQRNLEIRQLLYKLDQQLLDIRAEIQMTIADVDASYANLKASEIATLATRDEVNFLVSRWESNAFVDPTQLSQILDQLLGAEQSLITAEGNWVLSQKDYMISLARLRFATGQILDIVAQ